MRKVIRDGKVAVLYSPGFGAGWFSWNTGHPELLFLPEIVEFVEKSNGEIDLAKFDKLIEEIDEQYGTNYKSCYLNGIRDIKICWLDEGTEFVIDEYDGSESIRTRNDGDWFIA